MISRTFDIFFSLIGIFILSPIMILFSMLVWLQDFQNPIYYGARVGKNNNIFNMIKLRTMHIGADKTGVDSTSSKDNRITFVGHVIRRFKIDELFQLFNVVKGDMSLVGPRPNVIRDVALYSEIEKKILLVLPGITDISSIVFSDEGEILADHTDPDLAYNQLIRPWKSRLAILYISKKSIFLDLQIIFYTVVAIFSKQLALNWINKKLIQFNVDKKLIIACMRDKPLKPHPPPGIDIIIEDR